MTIPVRQRGKGSWTGPLLRYILLALGTTLLVLSGWAALLPENQQRLEETASKAMGGWPIRPTFTLVPMPTSILEANNGSIVTGRPITPAGEMTPMFPIKPPSTAVPTPRPIGMGMIDPMRFTYEQDWGVLEIQRYLATQPGVLQSAIHQAGRERIPIAAVLATQSLLYSINPKVLLTLLEMESGLVRNPKPDPNVVGWAMGYRQRSSWGLGPQINWAVRELYRAARDDPARLVREGIGNHALMRVLSQTIDRDGRPWSLERATATFVQTYLELFNEDPREPLEKSPSQTGPFLHRPYAVKAQVSAYFDHDLPRLAGNGSTLTFRGVRDRSPYDGHDGIDYALGSGVPVLAAAAGRVLVAGPSDDGCATPALAVILDHGNGYRTLYWHLSSIAVAPGQRVAAGQRLGLSGATGCANGAHLHFAVQYLGRVTDPNGWCASGKATDPWAVHPAGTTSRWLWVDEKNPCP